MRPRENQCMTLAPAELPATLQPLVHRALARLAQAVPDPIPAELQPMLVQLAISSDFALDTLVRQPDAVFVAALAALASEGPRPKPLYLRPPDAKRPGELP